MLPRQLQAGQESASTLLAIENSRKAWLNDLARLMIEAEDRFADVSWKLEGDSKRVYGHKAVLYARANAAFQARFLNPSGNDKLQAILSGSHLSLSLQPPSSPFSVSSSRAVSPTPSEARSVANRSVSVIPVQGTDSAFFKALLEFMYTASSEVGDVFSFLFEDPTFAQTKEGSHDKLAQDLLFVWRSKLFSDVSIQLKETLGEIPDELSDEEQVQHEEAIFSTHRAILSVRCPYFASIFLSRYSDSDAGVYTLPSPPFTPASLHFTLAYIYTGSLSINRTFDLATAMQTWRAAQYLSMDLLKEELECRMKDMCHAFKGCCKVCRTRSTRLFAFAAEPDVNSTKLQAASRPTLITHFGEVWGREVGELPYSVQKEIIVDLCSSTTASNAAHSLAGLWQVRERVGRERAAWADHLRSMLLPLEDRLRYLLRTQFADVAQSRPFVDLLEGVGFSSDVLERLLKMLLDSLVEKSAATTYEVLVGKVLLREEGIGVDARVRVEDARQGVLQYLKRRWMGVRSINGFSKLENWALKEISDEIGQSVDDLLQSSDEVERPKTKTGLRLAATKVHTVSKSDITHNQGPASLRASVLNRNAARQSTSTTAAFPSPSATSKTSSPRLSRASIVSSASPAVRPRVSSAFVSPSPSVNRNVDAPRVRAVSSPRARVSGNTNSNATLAPTKGIEATRSASTTASTSTTDRDRRASGTMRDAGVDSAASHRLASPQTARLKQPTAPRARVMSTESTKSLPTTRKMRADGPEPDRATRAVPASSSTPRPRSSASLRSNSGTLPKHTLSHRLPVDEDRQGLIYTLRAKSGSATAVIASPNDPLQQSSSKRSSQPNTQSSRPTSVTSVASRQSVAAVKTPSRPSAAGTARISSTSTNKSMPLQRHPGVKNPQADSKKPSSSRPDGASTKASIATGPQSEPETTKSEKPSLRPPGSALRVGITCVVNATEQIKLKATVRYIGEVLFSSGTFVGVEVPETAIALAQDVENGHLEWNDGSVDGVQYFELESSKPTSPLLERLHARGGYNSSQSSLSSVNGGRRTPVPGTKMGPSRGLFVLPSQVIYVF